MSVRARKAGSASAPAKLSTPGTSFAVRDQPITGKPRPCSIAAQRAPMAPSPMMPTVRMSARYGASK